LTDLKFFYRPKKTFKRYTHKTFFLSLLVMIILLTLYVWQRVMVIKLLKETEEFKEVLAQEEKKYKYLNLEITELSSIDRIEKIAHDKLGLIYPAREQIIYVDVGKLNKSTLPVNLWVKLKNLGKKLNPFEERGVQAKEIKHDL